MHRIQAMCVKCGAKRSSGSCLPLVEVSARDHAVKLPVDYRRCQYVALSGLEALIDLHRFSC
eukprot:6022293-Pleurochrysis_carterae.AAC.4